MTMMNKRLMVVGIAGIALGVVLVFLAVRKKHALTYSSPQSRIQVVLKPYNGKYKNNPAIKDFQARFPTIVKASVNKIKGKLMMKEPPFTVNVELDDSFDSDTFIKPSAAMQCPAIPYTPEKGNCSSYGIKLGALPITENYKGRTTVDKIMTHELTHVFMMFNIPNHENLPDYVQEGLPIHVAGQQDEIKKTQRENADEIEQIEENGGGRGKIPVHTYSDLIDKFENNFSMSQLSQN